MPTPAYLCLEKRKRFVRRRGCDVIQRQHGGSIKYLLLRGCCLQRTNDRCISFYCIQGSMMPAVCQRSICLVMRKEAIHGCYVHNVMDVGFISDLILNWILSLSSSSQPLRRTNLFLFCRHICAGFGDSKLWKFVEKYIYFNGLWNCRS